MAQIGKVGSSRLSLTKTASKEAEKKRIVTEGAVDQLLEWDNQIKKLGVNYDERSSDTEKKGIGFVNGLLLTPRGLYSVLQTRKATKQFPQAQIVAPFKGFDAPDNLEEIKVGDNLMKYLPYGIVLNRYKEEFSKKRDNAFILYKGKICEFSYTENGDISSLANYEIGDFNRGVGEKDKHYIERLSVYLSKTVLDDDKRKELGGVILDGIKSSTVGWEGPENRDGTRRPIFEGRDGRCFLMQSIYSLVPTVVERNRDIFNFSNYDDKEARNFLDSIYSVDEKIPSRFSGNVFLAMIFGQLVESHPSVIKDYIKEGKLLMILLETFNPNKYTQTNSSTKKELQRLKDYTAGILPFLEWSAKEGFLAGDFFDSLSELIDKHSSSLGEEVVERLDSLIEGYNK